MGAKREVSEAEIRRIAVRLAIVSQLELLAIKLRARDLISIEDYRACILEKPSLILKLAKLARADLVQLEALVADNSEESYSLYSHQEIPDEVRRRFEVRVARIVFFGEEEKPWYERCANNARRLREARR